MPRKNSHLLLWKNPFEGHSDLLDLLSYRFSTNPYFDATTHRFGEGTAADPSSQQASREGDRNHTNTTSKKVMIKDQSHAQKIEAAHDICLLYTSPSPRDTR